MDDAHDFGSGLRQHLGFEHVEPPPGEPAAAPIADDPRTRELELRLVCVAAAEDALAERERQLSEREREADEREAELAAQVAEATDARRLLRRRAEQGADRVWRSFADALEATAPDGTPDHLVRLAAARALLAEAYDGTGAEDGLDDELARLRHRRLGAAAP